MEKSSRFRGKRGLPQAAFAVRAEIRSSFSNHRGLSTASDGIPDAGRGIGMEITDSHERSPRKSLQSEKQKSERHRRRHASVGTKEANEIIMD